MFTVEPVSGTLNKLDQLLDIDSLERLRLTHEIAIVDVPSGTGDGQVTAHHHLILVGVERFDEKQLKLGAFDVKRRDGLESMEAVRFLDFHLAHDATSHESFENGLHHETVCPAVDDAVQQGDEIHLNVVADAGVHGRPRLRRTWPTTRVFFRDIHSLKRSSTTRVSTTHNTTC